MRKLLCLGISACMLVLTAPADAATFTVNTTGDPGTPGSGCDASECTLREAITAANANGSSPVDQILFSTSGSLVTSSGPLPAISTPTNISGPGPGALKLGPVGVNYGHDLEITSPSPGVSISGITAINGGLDPGAGVLVGAGAVGSLSNMVLYGNQTASDGGGIKNAGALTVADSVIGDPVTHQHNSAVQGLGAGIYNSGYLTLTRTTVGDNNTSYGGGGIYNSGTTTISDSTIAGNTSSAGGGGITNQGTLTVTNSTFSGNVAADFGGGIDNFGAGATTNLNAVTIAGNRANSDNNSFGDGGGTQNGIGPPAGITLQNTLYYANTVGGGASGPQCSGASHISAGYNLRSSADGGCTGFTGPGDIVNNGFALGPLAANGGLTLTRALPAGSAALNAGSPASPGSGGRACPVTDQRGLYRGGTAGRCDIGAFELGATVSPPAPPSLPPNAGSVPTGQRAAALKKCKKKHSKKKRKKCKKKANRLPL